MSGVDRQFNELILKFHLKTHKMLPNTQPLPAYL